MKTWRWTIDGDKDTRIPFINSDVFEHIGEFIKLINGIQHGDRINPEDEFAKQILIEDDVILKEAKELLKDVEGEYLGGMLSAITW